MTTSPPRCAIMTSANRRHRRAYRRNPGLQRAQFLRRAGAGRRAADSGGLFLAQPASACPRLWTAILARGGTRRACARQLKPVRWVSAAAYSSAAYCLITPNTQLEHAVIARCLGGGGGGGAGTATRLVELGRRSARRARNVGAADRFVDASRVRSSLPRAAPPSRAQRQHRRVPYARAIAGNRSAAIQCGLGDDRRGGFPTGSRTPHVVLGRGASTVSSDSSNGRGPLRKLRSDSSSGSSGSSPATC